eukprot:6456471-Amphidinium_carterae.1
MQAKQLHHASQATVQGHVCLLIQQLLQRNDWLLDHSLHRAIEHVKRILHHRPSTRVIFEEDDVDPVNKSAATMTLK